MNTYYIAIIKKMNEKLNKITSFNTYCDWHSFINETPEITMVQGLEIKRRDNGTVCHYGESYNSYEWVWNNRKIINDFISRLNREYDARMERLQA